MTDSALLIMDVQQGIVERTAGDADGLLERLRLAAEAARAAGMPVIYVRVAFRAGAPEVSARNRGFATLIGAQGFGEKDAATQVHSAIAPQSGDIVVTKKRVSAFCGSDLDVVLRAQRVTTVEAWAASLAS